MLILDGHGSYISFQFMNFYIKNQVIAFCLLLYIIHIFPPLNIGIFELFL